MTSMVKDFLPTRKIDLEKEDIYSEAPVEGGPKVAELSEDLVWCRSLGHHQICTVAVLHSHSGEIVVGILIKFFW